MVDNVAPATASTPVPPVEAPAEEPSLRDTIDAAFEAAASNEPRAPASDTAASDRARDERGRFAAASAPAAGPAAPALGPAAASTPMPPAPPAPPAEPLKAPASWRPEVREHWAQVPAAIQNEVARREREYQHTLQQAAQQRQFVDAFEQAVRPYEVFIRQENSNPIQAMTNMFQTAATLRVGTPMEKARIAADIVKNFGIDVVALDALLSGQQLPQGHQLQQPQQFRDPRVDQLIYQQQVQAQQADAFETEAIARGLSQFAEGHEFYRDVADTMADLVERASHRGETVDLEKIYNRACQLDEGVSKILAQRSASSGHSVQQHSQAVLRARRAATSVRSEATPDAGATVPKDDTVRAAVEAAYEASLRR